MRSRVRDLLHLALPIATAHAGLVLLGVVDTAVVGRLGATELAGVGLGNSVFFAITVVAIGIMMGVEPLFSQAVGAGEPTRARSTLWQGSWLSVIVGSLTTVVLLLATLFIGRIGIDPAVVEQTSIYIIIRSFSVVPMLLYLVIREYLQAFGRTSAMVIAMIIANVVNLLLAILLVFGGANLPDSLSIFRSVPQMGVAGSAIAALVASLLQLLVVVIAVANHKLKFDHFSRRFNFIDVKKAWNVGLPIGLQMGAEVGVFALVAVMAGVIGKGDLAAHQVAIMLASFTFTLAVGVGAAGSVLVGRSVGALDRIGARESGFLALYGGGLMMAVPAFLFMFFPVPVIRLLTNQPDVIRATVPLLFVAAFFQIFDGVQAVGAGILRGAGDTRFSFIANVLGHWAVGFPIALFLGFKLSLGIVGLWWGLCAGLITVSVVLVVRFERLTRREIVPLVHGG